MRRAAQIPRVRLNVHTAMLLDDDLSDEALAVDVFALYDIQVTRPLELDRAAAIVARWRPDLATR
jgi:hypothetical protein